MNRFTLALLLVLLARNAAGQFYDTRSMGLGGAPLRDGRATLRHANPAYTAVPDAGDPRAGWALPLGLLQALGELPTFDPDASGFDASAILQWQLQPPGPLALGRQAPLSEDDSRPGEGVHRAQTFSLGELALHSDLGRRYGVVALGVSGFAHHAVDADHDAASGEDVFRGWGVLQTGLALEASYGREFTLGAGGASGDDWLDDYWDQEDARPRLYVGATARRLEGVALTHLEGVAQGDAYDVVYTSALAGFDGGAAGGWGFDVGAVLRVRRLEVGVAAADLGSSLGWPDVRRDVVSSSGGVLPIADGARFETSLPTRTLLNARWRRTGSTWVLDAGGIGNRAQGHLGCEARRGTWIWRGGLGLDTRGQLQGGAGVGWRPAGWKVDLGLLTDSGNLDGSRALAVGLSVDWIR